MRQTAFALPLLVAAGASAQAVNATYAAGLLSALQSAGLTSLASVASSMASSTSGQALLARLSQGSNTLMAPSNAALASVNQALLSNATLLPAVLEYHILSGTFNLNGFATSPNHTIARTFLNDSVFVQLEGGAAQTMVVAYDNSTLRIRNQPVPITVAGTANYANLTIHAIDNVLTIPGDVNTLLSTYNLKTLQTSLGNSGIYPSLTAARGLTLFAPNDMAFMNASSTLSSLQPQQLQAVLANHVINGTTAYSSLLSLGKYTSAGGQPFSFSSNSSGDFVTSGSATARILLSNIVMENGVLHIIDAVLNNQQANTGAAQSAYNSYTASAATAVQETAAIGQTAAPSSQTSGGSNSNAATSQSGGFRMEAVALLGAVTAGAALLI